MAMRRYDEAAKDALWQGKPIFPGSEFSIHAVVNLSPCSGFPWRRWLKAIHFKGFIREDHPYVFCTN
jgi:hypothetical protein